MEEAISIKNKDENWDVRFRKYLKKVRAMKYVNKHMDMYKDTTLYDTIYLESFTNSMGKLEYLHKVKRYDTGKNGVVSSINGLIVDFIYDDIWVPHNKFIKVMVLDHKKIDFWGLIDMKGNVIIPPIYKYITDFRHDTQYTYLYTQNMEYGLIDLDGKFILPPVFSEIAYNKDEGVWMIAKKINNTSQYKVVFMNENKEFFKDLGDNGLENKLDCSQCNNFNYKNLTGLCCYFNE